jgi:lipopolysaccharide exporter
LFLLPPSGSDLMGDSLTSRTLRGLKWTYLSAIVNGILQIGFTAVLARLLDPAAFGIVAMSGVVLRFGSYFAQMGIGPGLVQKKEIADEEVRAAFTSSTLLGLLSFAVIWFLAPLATVIFHDQEVVPILKVMAISLFFTSLSTTSLGVLRRGLEFRSIAILETISYVVGYGAVAIVLARNGFGAWSLAVASVSQTAVCAVLAYASTRHSTAFVYRWKYFDRLFAFGSRFSVVSFVEFVGTSLDTFIIGSLVGARPLGLYNRGYMIVYLPMSYLSTTFSRVLFASYSKIQGDVERLGKAYLTSITLSAACIVPVCAWVIVCAREIVFVVLGVKWMEAVPLVQVFSISVTLLMLSQLAGIVCDATARLSAKLVLQSLHLAILGLLLFALKGFGLVGFAVAVMIGELVRSVGFAYLLKGILRLSYRQIVTACFPGFVNALVLGGVVFLATTLLRGISDSSWLIFFVESVMGGLVFGFLTLVVPRNALKNEVKRVLVQSRVLGPRAAGLSWIFRTYIEATNPSAEANTIGNPHGR